MVVVPPSNDPDSVLHPTKAHGTEWMYESDNTWYGMTNLGKDDGFVYTRHRKAHEVQIKVKGKRALVTQRGTIQMEPGDCVELPLGTAFTTSRMRRTSASPSCCVNQQKRRNTSSLGRLPNPRRKACYAKRVKPLEGAPAGPAVLASYMQDQFAGPD